MHSNTNLAPSQKSNSKNLFIGFVVFIIFVILAYTAVWFWAANKVDETVNQFSTNLRSQGSVLKCADQKVRGYPFRLGLFCSNLVFSNPVKATNVNLGEIRSAAQLYKPGHFIVEIDSPLKLEIPNLAPLIIDWESLRSSANLTTSGYKRISLVSQNIKIAANDAGFKSPLGTIKDLQIHSRPTPNDEAKNSLDLAVTITDWQIAGGADKTIEPLLVHFDVSMEQAKYIIETRQDFMSFLRTNGANGKITDMTFATKSGGKLNLSGPININQNGVVNGELTLNLSDPQKLVDYAGNVFPPVKAALEQTLPYLQGLADKSSGVTEINDLKINIKDSVVYLGFFRIGQIPRLF